MNNILAIRSPSGRVVGFHAGNLDIARLSAEAWEATSSQANTEALQALTEWDQEETQKDAQKTKPAKHQVRSLTVNVNQVCNLQCVYCAAGGDGSFGDPVKKISIEKTLPQIRFFLNKLEVGSTFRLTFLGGEPLLYPEGIEMIADYAQSLAQEKGIQIQFVVVTNGTQFHEKTISLLKKIKANITISIDGAAPINDQIRPTKGGKGSTELVIQGLQNLLQHKSELGRVGLSGVFGAMNKDVVSAYKFYRQFQVDWFDFTFDHTEVRPEISEIFAKGLADVAALAYEMGGEKELRKIKLFDTYFEILDSKVGTENYCGAGKSYFMIDARNNLYTCPWLVGQKNEIVGTGETLFVEKLKPYQEPLIEKNGCQDCWARFICGGGCMYMHQNKTGDKHQVDQNFCERTRYLITVAILYYEQSRDAGLIAGGQNYEEVI